MISRKSSNCSPPQCLACYDDLCNGRLSHGTLRASRFSAPASVAIFPSFPYREQAKKSQVQDNPQHNAPLSPRHSGQKRDTCTRI